MAMVLFPFTLFFFLFFSSFPFQFVCFLWEEAVNTYGSKQAPNTLVQKLRRYFFKFMMRLMNDLNVFFIELNWHLMKILCMYVMIEFVFDCVWRYACMRVCVYVCMYVYVRSICMCVYIYIYIHMSEIKIIPDSWSCEKHSTWGREWRWWIFVN